MFLLNSCLSLFSAATSLWHPLSRSYRVILPSSLTMLLPPALGFSPHPPVSVYGTGTYHTIAAFLDSFESPASLLLFGPHHVFGLLSGFASLAPTSLAPVSSFPVPVSPCVPTVLMICSTGISTCYPSTTSFDLALGPDLPRADQLYSGNLRYSAWRIPTSISLLIPAFSLLKTPQLLIGTASPQLRMLLYQCIITFLSFGVVF